MAKLGFVGLGLMGSRIVKRLLDAGYQVSGYNRTRSKAESLIQAGMVWKNSPKEVAQAADITFSMVMDTAIIPPRIQSAPPKPTQVKRRNSPLMRLLSS